MASRNRSDVLEGHRATRGLAWSPATFGIGGFGGISEAPYFEGGE